MATEEGNQGRPISRFRSNASVPRAAPSSDNQNEDCKKTTNPHLSNSIRETNYQSAGQYADAVRQWIWQYHCWNSMAMFSWSMSMHAMQSQMMNCQVQQPHNNTSVFVNGPGLDGRNPPPFAGIRQGQAQEPQPQNQPQNIGNNPQVHVFDFKIPPLWKRVTAEFIDFFILFTLKLGITLLTVEYGWELHQYDLETFLANDIDYDTAATLMTELIAMEIINRVFICIFETLCLKGNLVGMIGGATPGKRLIGIKVISCSFAEDLPNNMVRVIPAGNIGIWSALVRSVVKNFSLAFFFPVCFTVYFFQHSRAAYDIICNSIVVEMPLEERRRVRMR